MSKSLRDLVEVCVPGVSLDCVVFGYKDRSLHVLLLKYRHTDVWALPGGFLPQGSEMDQEVNKILAVRTGVENVYLEQFHTFSSIDRSWECNARGKATFNAVRSQWSDEDKPVLENWFSQRFISTAYFALVDCNQVIPSPDHISEKCDWISVTDLPELILDHGNMIEKALSHLRRQINFLPVGRELLEEKFTMIELQSLYEAILRQKLDRGNFQRKIMKMGMLVRHEKLMTGAQNKAPYLYSIDHKVYNQLLENGIGFT